MLSFDRTAGRRAGARGLRRTRLLLLLVPICCAAAGLAHSQLGIDRWTLHGLGRSSGGALAVKGSLGQAAVGISSGGALRLGGGFWIPVETEPAGVPAMDGLPAQFASYGCAPNPARDGTMLTIDLPRAAPVRVEAFSVDGARVAVLLDRPVSAGRLRVSWDAKGDDGRRLAAGVYLLAVTAGPDRATERVIVLH
jgi:hypothetical protein